MPTPTPETTRLLIDTDVALGVWHEGRPRDIDDGFAIVEAINSTEIDLAGITCVFGNGPLDEVCEVAKDLVRLKSSDVPVVRGASSAMQDDTPTNPAVDFLADRLREGPATIAAIGPLTNIGLLVKHYPEVIENIQQLILVAGRTPGRDFYIGDVGPVQDFNFEQDPYSVEILLGSSIHCVFMGFELTSQVEVIEADLDTIAQRDNPTAQYFYDNSLAWCRYWTKTFPSDKGFHPWDSAAIAWVLNPGWFVHERRAARVARTPSRLECSPEFDAPLHTYCTGFQPRAAKEFVDRVIAEIY